MRKSLFGAGNAQRPGALRSRNSNVETPRNMAGELLSLKWNSHHGSFHQAIGGLRNKRSYTDVTLACDGKFYPVHKFVLSTCSEYFSDIFEITKCKDPVVILKDIQCADLEYLLDYMYFGEVNVRQSEISSLIKAAKCLRINGLASSDVGPNTSSNYIGGQRLEHLGPPLKRKRSEELMNTDQSCGNKLLQINDDLVPQIDQNISSGEILGLPMQPIKLETVEVDLDKSMEDYVSKSNEHNVILNVVHTQEDKIVNHPPREEPIQGGNVYPQPQIPVAFMNNDQARDFVKKMLRTLLPYHIGMGDLSKRPIWWPVSVCWLRKRLNSNKGRGEIQMNKADYKATIVAYYEHNGISLDPAMMKYRPHVLDPAIQTDDIQTSAEMSPMLPSKDV